MDAATWCQHFVGRGENCYFSPRITVRCILYSVYIYIYMYSNQLILMKWSFREMEEKNACGCGISVFALFSTTWGWCILHTYYNANRFGWSISTEIEIRKWRIWSCGKSTAKSISSACGTVSCRSCETTTENWIGPIMINVHRSNANTSRDSINGLLCSFDRFQSTVCWI